MCPMRRRIHVPSQTMPDHTSEAATSGRVAKKLDFEALAASNVLKAQHIHKAKADTAEV